MAVIHFIFCSHKHKAQPFVHKHIQVQIKAYAHFVSVSCLEMDIVALKTEGRQRTSDWEEERLQTELCVVIVVKDVS